LYHIIYGLGSTQTITYLTISILHTMRIK